MDLQIDPLNKPVTSEVHIPGSKSYTNRSLILAALTKGTVTLKNPLFSNDTNALINCLKTLGINLEISENQIIVKGDVSQVKNIEYNLDTNLSGTTIRFILALTCIIPGIKKIYGGPGLNKRPIQDLVEGLKQLGANITYLEKEGFPPLLVNSSVLKPGIIKLKGDISSQFVSAILMILPLIGNSKIEIVGEQISKPYIDMTIDTMNKFSTQIINKSYQKYTVNKKQEYKIKNYLIEGDYSSAGYFFAIAALTKSKLTVKNLNPNSKQADIKFLEILKSMGNKITKGKNQITIEGKRIKPININMKDFPDQVQTLAVLAAFAKGTTTITGVSSLRVKETERVKALQQELLKMGIQTKSTKDKLVIYGGNPHKANINTYDDHRMAMSFAIAGSVLEGIVIKNSEVVNKTFPNFWEKLEKIGIKTHEV